MRRLAAICVALVVAAAAPRGPDPLAKAKALLDAGDFEKVLDEANQARGAKPAELAAVLGKAAALAFDKGDRWMAALYCERALAAQATERTALEICLRASLADERYEDSIRYGDVLGKLSPKDPQVALWRAPSCRALTMSSSACESIGATCAASGPLACGASSALALPGSPSPRAALARQRATCGSLADSLPRTSP